MAERITIGMIENRIAHLNEIAGTPAKPWVRDEVNKRNIAQIGNYHLTGEYGGYNVHKMQTEGGGVTTPLGNGYYTKRELFNLLNAFIRGFDSAKK